MSNPFAPPRDDDLQRSDASHPKRQRRLRVTDWLLVVVFSLVLVPGVLVNGILWFEWSQGMALRDLRPGGHSAWDARPTLVPLLAAVLIAARFGAVRLHLPLSRGSARAYTVLLAVALLSFGAARVPEPGMWGY